MAVGPGASLGDRDVRVRPMLYTEREVDRYIQQERKVACGNHIISTDTYYEEHR